MLTALSRFWEWLRHRNIPGLGEAGGRLLAKLRWSRWVRRTRMVTRRRPGKEEEQAELVSLVWPASASVPPVTSVHPHLKDANRPPPFPAFLRHLRAVHVLGRQCSIVGLEANSP